MGFFDKIKSALGAGPNHEATMNNLSGEQYKICVDHVNAIRVLYGAVIPDSEIDENIAVLSETPPAGLANLTAALCLGYLTYQDSKLFPDETAKSEIRVGDVITVHREPNPTCVEEIDCFFGRVTEVTDDEYTFELIGSRLGEKVIEITEHTETVPRAGIRIVNSTQWAATVLPRLTFTPQLIPSYRINGQKVRVNPEDPRSVRVG